MSEINPMYREGGEAMEPEIRRMTQLEWPLEVSSGLLPEHLENKTVGDIGAGPNPNLGKLVESRGGKFVAVDRNFEMAKKQTETNPNSVQADILRLPFSDKAFDILHTRFVLMNLQQSQRTDAIRELARCGTKNIIMDYNWEKFTSENRTILDFITDARKVAELAGSDLDHGGKLKKLIEEILPEVNVTEQSFNQGPIKNYNTLAGLAKSMLGLASNLQRIENDRAQNENRPVNQSLISMLEQIKISMQGYASEFAKVASEVDPEKVIPFTSPDIVAVMF